MPRTQITPQKINSAGLAPAYEPANVLGNSVRMAPGRVVHVKNASGVSVTVTVPTPASYDVNADGLAIPDRAVAVPAGADRLIGLGTTAVYRQPGGVAFLDYSAVTSVTVAVFDAP